ncbi:MAG: hypothetical protein OHK0017_07080 [Patescibacteria group bacterium]
MDGGFKFHQQELDFLKQQGFPINPFNTTAQNLDEVWEQAKKVENVRQSLPYPIDGLVVKLNDNETMQNLGVVGKTPRAWSAIKFAAEEVTTRLLNISWQVGRTGRVSPVADLEPVELAGTTVKRATLHNYKEVIETELHFHDTLVIRKAGDIIPEVLQVLTNLRVQEAELFVPPTECPACGVKLELSSTGVDLICLNTQNCKPQIVKRLAYFCQRNLGNITGLSEKQLEKFVDEFGIHDIADLYALPWEKIREMEGFGNKSVQNLQESVEKSKHILDYKFLAGLGIDGIGPEVAKLICDRINQS